MQGQNSLSIDHVRIDKPFFAGTILRIHTFPAELSVGRLDSMIAGRQLAVSVDGQCVASVLVDSRGREVVWHSQIDLSHTAFERAGNVPQQEGVRVLEVRNDHAMIWGKPVNSPRGIYRLDVSGVTLRSRLNSLSVLQRTQTSRVAYGDDGATTQHNNLKMVTPFGNWTLDRQARVTALDDGSFLILEAIPRYMDATSLYRYRIGPDGIHDWHQLPMMPGTTPVALLRYQGSTLLAVQGMTWSYIEVLGRRKQFLPNRGVTPINGRLLAAWQSPSELSYAYLTEVREGTRLIRRLYLSDQLIHEGSFVMSNSDIRWSPNGIHIAARVRDSANQGAEYIVTSTQNLAMPVDATVHDFVVDDTGSVAAYILTRGGFFHPNVHGRPHDAVPYAWNLGWTRSGAVQYNYVLAEYVYVIVDETHLRR